MKKREQMEGRRQVQASPQFTLSCEIRQICLPNSRRGILPPILPPRIEDKILELKWV